jgi:asparagine synthase (glutamine-hydrolysing)
MACSREIRLPFLDARLVDLVLPLDGQWKLHDGWSKWIFRKAMRDMMPSSITWRKDKLGFINPQALWLKREFSEAITKILSGPLLIEDYGLVDRSAFKSLYHQYCEQPLGGGRINYRDILNPITTEFWLRQFSSGLAAP